jgi:hypothetical protein
MTAPPPARPHNGPAEYMDQIDASQIPGVGPFSPTLRDQVERVAQLRSMATAAFMLRGPHDALWRTLRAAEVDPIAFERARELIEAMPALWPRKLFATFSRVTWPRGRR